ncbi:2,3-diaminopropionate biosynthesis protein SbnA [Paenibacillus woosongensis]|uniref:N-(2-amino-2-carboxyethyl)-L-glutamate synthase n=1 Tax=Paenibacillus woosongensis TaxID=307580 RepID=A0AA95I8L6_9BACL|nr:2,3-diaminopropionate biosynthesis protein SbnA [Paenibacillus woosongensis]WHX48542.1 2,3-diaminopropionate biosynthesis protein SbnA [Paenibacillus woosongensis]
MVYERIIEKVGETPVIQINSNKLSNIDLFAKLEFYNPTGSVKDRASNYLINKLLEMNIINKDTTIIESSSGNFGISLSTYCKHYGLKFYCVIDPLISPINEMIIQSLCTAVIKVQEPDSSGGYLLKRIEKVKELVEKIPNSYWVNQYGNLYNAEAYFYTLGNEIVQEISDIDYLFMGVSSGGTITGVSRKIKEVNPSAKIIAVDIIGSVIFGGNPQKRHIPGIGSSMVPDILTHAVIDDVVMVDELTTINMCHYLLQEHSVFVGGSSGSVLGAVMKYFAGRNFEKKPKVVVVFPDRGDRYASTIYNEEWVHDLKKYFDRVQI